MVPTLKLTTASPTAKERTRALGSLPACSHKSGTGMKQVS